MARFLDECVIANANASEKAREMFAAWTKWCLSNGEPPGSEVEFADSMGKRGFGKKRTSAGMVYRGVMLASQEEEPEGKEWL